MPREKICSAISSHSLISACCSCHKQVHLCPIFSKSVFHTVVQRLVHGVEQNEGYPLFQTDVGDIRERLQHPFSLMHSMEIGFREMEKLHILDHKPYYKETLRRSVPPSYIALKWLVVCVSITKACKAHERYLFSQLAGTETQYSQC